MLLITYTCTQCGVVFQGDLTGAQRHADKHDHTLKITGSMTSNVKRVAVLDAPEHVKQKIRERKILEAMKRRGIKTWGTRSGS